MKKIFITLGAFMCLQVSMLSAQSLILPQPSPKSVLKQTVGLTDVEVTYSRPGAKGRNVFGELVPYNELWRTGANMATVVRFSDDVTIEGQKLAKGEYALFTIPGKNEWTIIFNKNTNQGGTEQYKKEEDALRVKVKAQNSDFTETFTINIDSIRNESALMVLDWEKTEVPVRFTVPTQDKANQNIKSVTGSAWNNYARAASYLMENNGDMNEALKLAEQSIQLNQTFYNTWVKAQILAKQNNFTEAADFAEKAVELGKASGSESSYRFYSERIESHAKEYREKAGPVKKKKKK